MGIGGLYGVKVSTDENNYRSCDRADEKEINDLTVLLKSVRPNGIEHEYVINALNQKRMLTALEVDKLKDSLRSKLIEINKPDSQEALREAVSQSN